MSILRHRSRTRCDDTSLASHFAPARGRHVECTTIAELASTSVRLIPTMRHQFSLANHNHMLHFLCFYWSLNLQISGSRKFPPVTWEGTEVYESYLILQQMLIWWIQKAAVSSHCFLEKKKAYYNYSAQNAHTCSLLRKDVSCALLFWETTIRLKGASGQTRGAPEVMDSSVFGGAKGRLILKAAVQNPPHKLTPPKTTTHRHKSNYTHTSTI